MTPPDQDAPRLQEILSQFYAGRIDRNAARSGVIDVVQTRIGCARVSMWKFEGAEGDLNLLCFAARSAGGELDVTERRLAQGEYSEYFNTLIERGTFVSADAMNDPALQSMRESYLIANNVTPCSTPPSCSTAALTAWSAARRLRRRARGVPATCLRYAPSSPGSRF